MTALLRLLRVLALGLIFAAPALVVAAPAHAQSLDAAKAAGLVGERPDGLIGVVGDAPPDIRRLVEEVNARRLANYAEIARKNGTALAAVQAIAGPKLIEQAPPGSYVMGPGGWRRK